MKRWAACAIAVTLALGSGAASHAGSEQVPAAVQAKLDTFLQCVKTQKGAQATGGMYALCGARFDRDALACLRHHTRTEADTVDPKQFPGHTMYSFAVYCSVPPSLVGIMIEKSKKGRWAISVAMPMP